MGGPVVWDGVEKSLYFAAATDGPIYFKNTGLVNHDVLF